MRFSRLIARSLLFYRATGLAVAAGVTVATAVITGSLIVGDSMRGSVRDTVLGRLGKIDHAITAPHFFREQLAIDLLNTEVWRASGPRTSRNHKQDACATFVPVTLGQGAARNVQTNATVPAVSVISADAAFWQLFPGEPNPELAGREAAVNESTARDLGVAPGDFILLNVQKRGRAPSDSLFARHAREDVLRSMRLKVKAVLPDAGVGDGGQPLRDSGRHGGGEHDGSPIRAGAGGFSLLNQTQTPRNVFVAKEWLAKELDAQGLANTLLIESSEHAGDASRLRRALESALTLDDAGLTLDSGSGCLWLKSGTLTVPIGVDVAESIAKAAGARAYPASVYLATTIARQDGGELAYAVMGAIDPVPDGFFGKPAELGDDGILLNSWAADDLGAKIGDRLDASYFLPTHDGIYRTREKTFEVRGVIPMDAPACDPALVPEFEGITETETIADWEPPFPIELNRVTARDDEYWQRYRALPKAWIPMRHMEDIWSAGRSGERVDHVTAIRFEPANVDGDLAALRDELAQALPPRTVDSFPVLPVLRMALEAGKGTTDFGVLFVSMSMFLVIAAAGLAGTLMRLMAERRAAEAGMLMACGFTGWHVLQAILGEGAVLTILGAAAGCGLGVLYANAIVSLLASGAIGTIGNARLNLHVQPGSMILGAIIGGGAGFASTWWGVRKLVRRRVLDLLAGWRAIGTGLRSARLRLAAAIGAAAAIAATVLVGLGLAAMISPTAAFFGGGFALLAAAICTCYLALAMAMRRATCHASLRRLIVRSASANRLRSMLAVGLFASAAFVIIATAANRRDYSRIDVHDRSSGTGGFALRATSSLPIRYDFGTESGREKLGFSPEDQTLFDGVKVYSFLSSPGDDISCLNLAKAGMPKIIGASDAFIERGGFGLRGMTARDAEGQRHEASWASLREREWCGSRTPVIGDAGSVQWSLHSGLGKTIALPEGAGNALAGNDRAGNSGVKQGRGIDAIRPRPAPTGDHGWELCVAGVIPNSIFAGELVMYDRRFRRIYPSERDPRYFLIETPPGREDGVADALRRNMGDAGLEVRNTGEILNSIISVQNTYLSTFTALGGLGVALGTFGLAAVLLRSALERRGEFALMLATGFRRVQLVWLLALENAGLLAIGLLAGSAAALVAVVPQLRSAEADVNWLLLALVPAATLALGLVVCIAAAAAMLRGNLVEALREE